jgi:ABC-type molybdate transport system substrate-binding protein
VTSELLVGRTRSLFCFYVALVALAASICPEHGLAQTSLSVSAAASLKDALADVETAYAKSHTHLEFSNNFGSSGTLAMQIDQGAPADVFLSAAAKPMDDLQAKGLIVAGTRGNLLRNSLVLIVPLDSGLHDFQGLTGSQCARLLSATRQAFRPGSMDVRRWRPFICWRSSAQSLCSPRMCARF